MSHNGRMTDVWAAVPKKKDFAGISVDACAWTSNWTGPRGLFMVGALLPDTVIMAVSAIVTAHQYSTRTLSNAMQYTVLRTSSRLLLSQHDYLLRFPQKQQQQQQQVRSPTRRDRPKSCLKVLFRCGCFVWKSFLLRTTSVQYMVNKLSNI